MKKLCVLMVLMCALAGCGVEVTMETVADDILPVQAEPREIRVELPGETVLPAM